MNNQYISQYNKNNYKQYIFRVRKDDELVINKLDRISNRNSYLRYLVANDVDKKKDIYTLSEIKKIIKPILNSYQINDIYLFGSYARGEANKDSDVDIYCEKGKIKTLIEQGRMEEELEKALKKDVDIVFKTSKMDAYFKKQIMEDMIILYLR